MWSVCFCGTLKKRSIVCITFRSKRLQCEIASKSNRRLDSVLREFGFSRFTQPSHASLVRLHQYSGYYSIVGNFRRERPITYKANTSSGIDEQASAWVRTKGSLSIPSLRTG